MSSIPMVHPSASGSMYSFDPMVKAGLYATSVSATLSAISTLSLLCFITHRAIYWKRYYTHPLIYNQSIILLLNLFVGDLFQAVALLFGYYWIWTESIVAGPTCNAQAILVTIGDVSSGAFVFLISIHTSVSVLTGRPLPLKCVVTAVITCWVVVFIVSCIGPGIYGSEYFGAVAFWCWVRQEYEGARIWSHYLWTFMFELGTLFFYLVTFFVLRRRIKSHSLPKDKHHSPVRGVSAECAPENTLHRVNKATYCMVVYPTVYFVNTAPLAVGRMYTMSTGKIPPMWFFVLAGCLYFSAGWVDVVIYALTRRHLIRAHNHSDGTKRSTSPSEMVQMTNLERTCTNEENLVGESSSSWEELNDCSMCPISVDTKPYMTLSKTLPPQASPSTNHF